MTQPLRRRARVLLTGNYRSREFQAPVDWLHKATELECFARLSDAGARLRQLDADPLLIVVVQSYPGQYSASQVEQLHRQSPLSRIVALLGSWCEGEVRSARPWPGVIRLYWHQFQARLSPLLKDTANGCPLARLPRTSTTSEQLEQFSKLACGGPEFPPSQVREAHTSVPTVREPVGTEMASSGQVAGDLQPNAQFVTNEGLIAVRTRRYTDFDALGEALRQGGYSAVWLRETGWRNIRGATAIVWDAAHCDWRQPQQLEELQRLSQTTPVIALMNFPRHDDRTLITNAGVSGIVSCPFLLSDLNGQIDRQARRAVPQRSVA